MTAVADRADVIVSAEPLRAATKSESRGFIPYALIGVKVGTGVAKAVMTASLGSHTPEALGAAVMSATSVRDHVQAELVHLIAVRVSLHTPQQLGWLLRLVTEYCATASTGGAVTALATQTLRYHVTAFGLYGTVASAVASAAVGALCSTCTLLTSNVAFWRAESTKMSVRQYQYDLATNIYSGIGAVAGSGLGALVGSAVMPGFGTVFGSVTVSLGSRYAVSSWRKGNGPDDRRRRYLREAATYEPLAIESFRFDDPETGEVIEGSMLLETGEMRTVKARAHSGNVGSGKEEPNTAARQEREVGDIPVGAVMCDSSAFFTRRRAAGKTHSRPHATACGGEDAAEKEEATVYEAGLVPSCLSLSCEASAPEQGSTSPPSSTQTPISGDEDTLWKRLFSRRVHSDTPSPVTVTDASAQNLSSSSPPSSSAPPRRSHATELERGVAEACQLAGNVTALEEVHSWADVDRAVESCGPEEMVLVFAARHDGASLILPE